MATILDFTAAGLPDVPPLAAEGGAAPLLSAFGPAAPGEPVGATGGWPPPDFSAPGFSLADLFSGSAADPAALLLLLGPQAVSRNPFPAPQAAEFLSGGPVASPAGGGGGAPFAAPSLDVLLPPAELGDRSSVETERAPRPARTFKGPRKVAELTPDELTVRRRKNNVSARGYREKQRTRLAELDRKNKRLAAENYFLRQKVAELAARVLQLYGHPVSVPAAEPFREAHQTQECQTRAPVSTPPPLAGSELLECLDGGTGQERRGDVAADQDLLSQLSMFPVDVPECSDGQTCNERREDVAAGEQDLLNQLSVFPLELQRELCGLFADAGQADAASESAGGGAHLPAPDLQSDPDGPSGPVGLDRSRPGSPGGATA